jgi:hypothetical protein
MKIYANRYGMIESFELAFALQNAAQRRRTAADEQRRRAERRALRAERWRARGTQAARAASALFARLREATLREAAAPSDPRREACNV